MKISIFFALLLAFGQLQAGEHPGQIQPQSRTQGQTSATLSQAGGEAWSGLDRKKLKLRSASALIVDGSGNKIYSKQSQTPLPIGSITKLMTVMVILDAQLPLDEKIRITKQDRDLIRLTGSRLRYGATLSRGRLLELALMASENRAASALARTYPGGSGRFIQAMNAKARQLGMSDSRFTDAAGLDAGNVASPEDLVKMVRAASEYPEIVQATTRLKLDVRPYPRLGPLTYGNTNRLLKNRAWEISLSKTGYINEAGRCLVMLARVNGRELIFVLLNSFGKLTPFGDANRVRKWIERGVSG
ncbi:serine hydrolase [Sedimenticola hydrogenitrophicus]|uniref:serine hydrolase n=1 Tax=Sedimenticola hydrogenitrophicus TaxID=2967975 RepID=UPI0023AFEDA7|nr:serine hydrolase [Sedimenticola hydrogenitrophicus]